MEPAMEVLPLFGSFFKFLYFSTRSRSFVKYFKSVLGLRLSLLVSLVVVLLGSTDVPFKTISKVRMFRSKGDALISTKSCTAIKNSDGEVASASKPNNALRNCIMGNIISYSLLKSISNTRKRM